MDHLLNIGCDKLLEGYRYETKIPLQRSQLVEFLPFLYQLGIYPRQQHANRRINSVYYDTQIFGDYEDNISGIGDRSKTRIRWYNGDISQLAIERKIKKNKASRKEVIRLDNQACASPQTNAGTRMILNQNREISTHILMGPIFPVLEVQYDRQYFLLGPDLRMTIDTKQKFKRLHPSPVGNYVSSPVHAVIEFKYPASQNLAMRMMVQNIPFRVFRHSKYVIGLETTAQ